MMPRLIPVSAIALLLLATTGSAGPDKVTFPAGYTTNHVLYATVVASAENRWGDPLRPRNDSVPSYRAIQRGG
jgi:hypothetical protein